MPTLIRMDPDNAACPGYPERRCDICDASDDLDNEKKRFSLTVQPGKDIIRVICLNCQHTWDEPVGLVQEMKAQSRRDWPKYWKENTERIYREHDALPWWRRFLKGDPINGWE